MAGFEVICHSPSAVAPVWSCSTGVRLNISFADPEPRFCKTYVHVEQHLYKLASREFRKIILDFDFSVKEVPSVYEYLKHRLYDFRCNQECEWANKANDQ